MESSSTIASVDRTCGRRPDADRGAAAHRGQPPGDRRRADARRQRLADLVRAARPRRCGRRRAREARRAARRHGRDHARQPPRVPHRRSRGGDARRDAVLDLRDLSGGGDSRTCSTTPARKVAIVEQSVPARDARGAHASCPSARARDRRRRRRAAAGRSRWPMSRAPTRASTPSRPPPRSARRRPDADLHLGHDRAAEGRSALAPRR